jgi:uncharacterized protein
MSTFVTVTDQPTANSSLTIRRLLVDLSTGFDRHWNGGDAFRSAYMNALSMSFPVGEQFFIEAVRNGAAKLPSDARFDALRQTVREFIGQEATHRQLHSIYNAELERQGFKNHWGPRALQRVEKARAMRRRLHSRSEHFHELAVTAAFEHYTAVFGEQTLCRQGLPGDWLAGAQAPLQTLWRWHAAEETEHKSVAFDLYRALGGNERSRLFWFAFVSVIFTVDALRQTTNNLWHDKTLFKPSTWLSGVNFFWGRSGFVWRCFGASLAYFRKDFHPTQVGQAHLADDWLKANSALWQAVGRAPVPPQA